MKWIWGKDRQTNTLTLTPVVSLLYIPRPTWSARVHTVKGIKRKLRRDFKQEGPGLRFKLLLRGANVQKIVKCTHFLARELWMK